MRPASDDHVVLRLEGFLDISRYPEFRSLFEKAPRAPILVDLRDVEGVDSIFLSELLLFRRRHAPLLVATLIRPGGEVAHIFALAEMGKRVDIFDDHDAALKALAAQTG